MILSSVISKLPKCGTIFAMASEKKLRIGFDFDGVIAYNPLRMFRAPLMALKHQFQKRPDLEFPLPKNPQFKWLWVLAHETSYFPAHGLSDLRKLLEKHAIEGYIVTGRYSFLEDSLNRWLKKHKADHVFKGVYVNKADEQPHRFKKEMIEKLKLDMFVEDNWDIVKYLKNAFDHEPGKQAEIHWIYNIVDRFQKYPRKYPNLKAFIKIIKTP